MRPKSTAGVRAAALAAAVGLLLAGCGNGSTESSNAKPTGGDTSAAPTSGSITVWADDTRADIIKQVAATCAADQGYKVDVLQHASDKMLDDFTKQAPTGKGPDVIIGANDWTGKLVQAGTISPVELGDKAGEFQQVATDAFTYDGQTYGVPYAVENIALVRNTKLAPKAPSSWDDMIATGDKLVKQGKAKLPFAVQQDPANGDPYHLFPLQTSFGSSIFATAPSGGYDPTKLVIGDQQGLAFAKWLSKEGKAKVLNTNVTYDIATGEFAKGKVPYIITGPWALSGFDDGGVKYSIEEIPSPGPDPAVPFVGVQGAMVSKYSKNALVANDFVVNCIGSEGAQQTLYEAGQRPSAMTSVFEASKTNPVIAGFGAVGAAGQPLPNIPAMDAVWGEWGKTEAAIIKGGDPTKLWKQMTSRIESALAG